MRLRRGICATLVVLALGLVGGPTASAADPKPLKTFKPKSGELSAMALSPDGKTLVTGDEEFIKLIDVATGKETAEILGITVGPNSLAFSADGRTVYLGDMRGDVRTFETSTGKEGARLTPSTGKKALALEVPLALSPDGKLLASGAGGGPSEAKDTAVHLWDLATGKVLHTLKTAAAHMGSLTFSPDGKLLATVMGAENIVLWEVETGQKVGELGFGGPALAFTPDGTQVVARVGGTKWIGVWDVSSASASGGDPLRLIKGHTNDVTSIAISPDGSKIISACENFDGSKDTGVRIWDFKTGKRLRVFTADPKGVLRFQYTADRKTFMTGGLTAVKLWDAAQLFDGK